MKLSVGQMAPEFTAPDQTGQLHSLHDSRGQYLLLYFYPQDDTPGCTAQACGLRDAFHELSRKAVVLGVSGDSQESHQRFADKYSLPFPLLADPGKKIIKAYGADGLLFAKRVSFLIDSEGKIAKIYDKVKPEEHAQEVLADVEALV